MTEPFSAKKPSDFTRKLLTNDAVRLIARQVCKFIDSMVEGLPGAYGHEIENSVRFQAVATRLREARERIGIDIKLATKLLRVPQYQLRHIEKCDVKRLDPCILQRYVVLLVQEKWFARWRRANRKLAARLALNAKPGVSNARAARQAGAVERLERPATFGIGFND